MYIYVLPYICLSANLLLYFAWASGLVANTMWLFVCLPLSERVWTSRGPCLHWRWVGECSRRHWRSGQGHRRSNCAPSSTTPGAAEAENTHMSYIFGRHWMQIYQLYLFKTHFYTDIFISYQNLSIIFDNVKKV